MAILISSIIFVQSSRLLTPSISKCVRASLCVFFLIADHFYGVSQWNFQNKNRTSYTPHPNSYTFCWATSKGEYSIRNLYYDWLWLWLIFIMANLESNFNKQKTSVVTVIAVILLLWQILNSLSSEADSSYSAWPLWVAIYY